MLGCNLRRTRYTAQPLRPKPQLAAVLLPKNCFKKITTNFHILTLGNEVYLHRVIYLKNLRLTESDFQVFCMFLNERINKKKL